VEREEICNFAAANEKNHTCAKIWLNGSGKSCNWNV